MTCISGTRIYAESETLNADWYRLGKVPAQAPLLTDVLDEYGQLQVKTVAVEDEHEPP